ncbi:MAG TPA: hypothetical protein VF750_01015 [Sphingomicrobium sp.]
MRWPFIALSCLLLIACSPSDVIEKGLTVQERSQMRGAINDLSRGDRDGFSKKLAPQLGRNVAALFPQMHSALPRRPLAVSLINANWSVIGTERTAHAVYEVEGNPGWALVAVSSHSIGGRVWLTSFYVKSTPTSPKAVNPFSLAEAGYAQWGMIVAMLVALGITIAAVVRIWRSGLFRRRWLWTIGALIGVATVRLNWSSGAFAFQPLSFQLFSASATKVPIFAPWVLSVSLPVVALVALFVRREPDAERVGPLPNLAPPSSDG